MISELKPCAFPFAGKWMWHWASLSTLLSLSLALISDANLWNENNKGNRRILTCRYCGCYWSIYLRRMVSGMFSIFAYIMTAFLLICRWHLAAACCALGNQLYVALLKGGWNGSCFVGLVDTSFLQNFFPGLQDMLLSERLLTFSFGFGCFSLETRYRLKRFSRVV